MSLSDLPLEVLSNIVRCLACEGKIAQYAAISGVFQEVVEKRLLRSLHISSLDLKDFGTILDLYSYRKEALRNVTFSVVLPTYSDKACSWFENEEDKTTNNEVFTAAISHLFRILSSCDNVARAQPISLSLGNAYSLMDIDRREPETREADQFAVETNKRKDLFEHRYEHSYIMLLRPESLPIVRRVNTIHVNSRMHRSLAPATAVHITSKLPGVQKIEWELVDTERKYREARTKLRHDFSEALESIHSGQATDLKLYLSHEPPNNEGYTNFDVRSEGRMPLDSFSTLLGDFLRTSDLVKINLGGPMCLGPEVFRLANEGVSWPCLQEFLVTISGVRPDGGWYLDRGASDSDDEDSDDEANQAEYVRMAEWNGIEDVDADTESSSSGFDSDESFFDDSERPPDSYNESRERYRQGMSPVRSFRTIPSPALEELLKAAAQAVPHMKALRTFSVGADIQPSTRTGCNRQVFEFVLAAAGYGNWMDQEVSDQHQKRLTWTGPREWRPSQDLADAWQEALGDDGMVRYQDW